MSIDFVVENILPTNSETVIANALKNSGYRLQSSVAMI
jgi:hypothetical protein